MPPLSHTEEKLDVRQHVSPQNPACHVSNMLTNSQAKIDQNTVRATASGTLGTFWHRALAQEDSGTLGTFRHLALAQEDNQSPKQ